MSTRRRIKAAAILPPKRSTREGSKSSIPSEPIKLEQKSVFGEQIVDLNPISNVTKSAIKNKSSSEIPILDDKSASNIVAEKTKDNHSNNVKQEIGEAPKFLKPEQVDANDNEVFKSPPIVANHHNRADAFIVSDVENDRTDDSHVTKISSQGPASPVKFRQRIRPTPFFGMRRNSTQGYGSDVEEEPKRQRHSSTSSNTGSTTPQRMRPHNIQRIRTESSCSNISDYMRDNNNKSTRKATSEEHSRLHAARKDFLVRFNGRVPEKSAMKMSDLIYYNPITNPMVASELQLQKPVIDKTIIKPEKIEKSDEENVCMPVPQLKLGPDGEMIVDEQSLVIETTAEKEARETLANTKVIYMDEFSGNNGFYRRSKRTRDWPSEETIKFYRCLHTVGTDFSLMLTLFPNRTRRELKLKFKKEERTNLNLINKALLFPKAFNVAELKQELDKEQQEYDAKKKDLEEINKKKAEKIKRKPRKRPAYNSKTANILSDGDLVYEQKAEPSDKVNPPKLKKIKTDNVQKVQKCKKSKSEIQKKCTKQENSEVVNVGSDNGDNILRKKTIVKYGNNDLGENTPDNGKIIATISEPLCLDSFDQINPCEQNVNSVPGSTIESYTYTINTNPIEIAPEIMYEPTWKLTPGKTPNTITTVDTAAPESKSSINKKSDELNTSIGKNSLCSEFSTRLSVTHAETVHFPKAESEVEFMPKELVPVDNDDVNYVDSSVAEKQLLSEASQQFSGKENAGSPKVEHFELKLQPLCSPKIENRINTTADIDEKMIDNEVINNATEKTDHCIKKDVIYDYRSKAKGAFSDQENEDILEYNSNSKQNSESEQGVEEKIVTNRKVTKGEIATDSEVINNDSGAIDEADQVKDIEAEMERFMLNDLGTILTNLVNGSLVVVASEDESDPAKMINEIYVMNKETSTLSNSPLDLPEDIVNCIVEELNMS